jgi:Ca2+-binding EF-hand superfamily protein
MTYEEFANGYRSVDKSVDDETLNAAWDLADVDRNKRLSWDEFHPLFDSLNKDDEIHRIMDTFWEKYASDPKGGLHFEEFRKILNAADANLSDE